MGWSDTEVRREKEKGVVDGEGKGNEEAMRTLKQVDAMARV